MHPFRRLAESSHAVASDNRLVFPPLHDKDGSRARVWRAHEMMLHVARFSKMYTRVRER